MLHAFEFTALWECSNKTRIKTIKDFVYFKLDINPLWECSNKTRIKMHYLRKKM